MKIFDYIKNNIEKKKKYFSLDYLKSLFKKHGMAFLIIVVGWEIVEDVVAPIIFGILGNYVNPIFYTGIPASLILCFHWAAVPILFGIWLKISGSKEENVETVDCCDKH